MIAIHCNTSCTKLLIAFFVLWVSSTKLSAQTISANVLSAPTTSGDGSFTITVQRALISNYTFYVLQERVGTTGNDWRTIAGSSVSGNSHAYDIEQTLGTYSYRIRATVQTGPSGSASAYSTPIVVSVQGSASNVVFDDLFAQRAYSFEVKRGNINGGRMDLYIRRTTGDMDNGVVAETMHANRKILLRLT